MKRRTSFFSQGRSVCGHRGKNELVSQCQRTFLNPPDIVITSGGKGKNMYMLLFGYHIYRVMICWKRQWSTLWLSVGYFVCIVTFYFLHWKPDTWTVMNHLLESMWRFTRKETISRSFFVTGPLKLFTPVKLTFFLSTGHWPYFSMQAKLMLFICNKLPYLENYCIFFYEWLVILLGLPLTSAKGKGKKSSIFAQRSEDRRRW